MAFVKKRQYFCDFARLNSNEKLNGPSLSFVELTPCSDKGVGGRWRKEWEAVTFPFLYYSGGELYPLEHIKLQG